MWTSVPKHRRNVHAIQRSQSESGAPCFQWAPNHPLMSSANARSMATERGTPRSGIKARETRGSHAGNGTAGLACRTARRQVLPPSLNNRHAVRRPDSLRRRPPPLIRLLPLECTEKDPAEGFCFQWGFRGHSSAAQISGVKKDFRARDHPCEEKSPSRKLRDKYCSRKTRLSPRQLLSHVAAGAGFQCSPSGFANIGNLPINGSPESEASSFPERQAIESKRIPCAIRATAGFQNFSAVGCLVDTRFVRPSPLDIT